MEDGTAMSRKDPGAAKRAKKKHQQSLDTESRQRALGLLEAAEWDRARHLQGLRKSRR
jgi:hypothetical protein